MFAHMSTRRGLAILSAGFLLSACASGDAGLSATAENVEKDAEVLEVKGDSLQGEKTRLQAKTEETEKTLERLYEGQGFAW